LLLAGFCLFLFFLELEEALFLGFFALSGKGGGLGFPSLCRFPCPAFITLEDAAAAGTGGVAIVLVLIGGSRLLLYSRLVRGAARTVVAAAAAASGRIVQVDVVLV